MPGSDWSEREVRLAVADYFAMLEAELLVKPYSPPCTCSVAHQFVRVQLRRVTRQATISRTCPRRGQSHGKERPL
jgi:hypothetical protein